MKNILLIILALLVLSGCAGMNPNPGERTSDMAWTSGNFSKAISIVIPKAEAGEPWAQLRLGIFYVNGMGVEKDNKKAEYWYTKAAAQKASGNWANGLLAGATGPAGYFNQNNDALIAQFNLAELYFNGNEGVERDLEKAYILVNKVIEQSNGNSLFFCCEFNGGRHFTQEQFTTLRDKIKAEMSSNRK